MPPFMATADAFEDIVFRVTTNKPIYCVKTLRRLFDFNRAIKILKQTKSPIKTYSRNKPAPLIKNYINTKTFLQEAYWLEQYSWALFKAMSHMLCIGYGR